MWDHHIPWDEVSDELSSTGESKAHCPLLWRRTNSCGGSKRSQILQELSKYFLCFSNQRIMAWILEVGFPSPPSYCNPFVSRGVPKSWGTFLHGRARLRGVGAVSARIRYIPLHKLKLVPVDELQAFINIYKICTANKKFKLQYCWPKWPIRLWYFWLSTFLFLQD